MQNTQLTLHFVRTLYMYSDPNVLRNWRGDIKTHSSVRLLVCLFVPLSVTKTKTWLMSSEVLKIEHNIWYEWSLEQVVPIGTMSLPRLWPWLWPTSMSIYFARPGDNNYPNLLVKFTFTLKCRHDVINKGGNNYIRQHGCFLWKRWCRIDKYLECPTSTTNIGVLLTVLCCF